MPDIFIYFFKLSVCIAVFYLFYRLVLRGLTFYKENRYYLAGYALISFLLPFLNIYPFVQVSKSEIGILPVLQKISVEPLARSVNNHATGNAFWLAGIVILVSGIIFLSLRLLVQYVSLQRIKHSAPFIMMDNIRVYSVNTAINPFSFGNSIFINDSLHDEHEFKQIVLHEFVHVKQNHTADLVIAELICILNWFNPFAWLMRNAIRENLEFLADKQVLLTGIDAKQYQYLLLKVMGGREFTITSHLNFSSLKKRIAMMNTFKSAKIHLVKFAFLLPLSTVLLFAFRQKINADFNPQVNLVAQTNSEPKSEFYLWEVNPKLESAVTRKEVKITVDTIAPVAPMPPAPAKLPVSPAAPAPTVTQDCCPVPLLVTNGVKSMHVENNQVLIKNKNGSIEKYNLNDPDEKASFYRKYGTAPAAPKPAAHPVPPTPSVDVDLIEVPVKYTAEKIVPVKYTIEKMVPNKYTEEKMVPNKYTEEQMVPVKYTEEKIVPVMRVKANDLQEVKPNPQAKPAIETEKPVNKNVKPLKEGTQRWPAGSPWLPKKDNC